MMVFGIIFAVIAISALFMWRTSSNRARMMRSGGLETFKDFPLASYERGAKFWGVVGLVALIVAAALIAFAII